MIINPYDQDYKELIDALLSLTSDNRNLRDDRTGVGTYSLFGEILRVDLRKVFPLLTIKKMGIKSVLSELLWFIEGVY